MDNAYAAGNASRITSTVDRMLAVNEFAIDGHGPESKNDRNPSSVSGAARSGGFFAASVSAWNEVSTIHSTGSTNSSPTTQASPLSAQPPPRLFLPVTMVT